MGGFYLAVAAPKSCNRAAGLVAGDGRMLYVPWGLAHGFCTLEPMTEVADKVTVDYSPDADRGIEGPVPRQDAVLSDKDGQLPRFAERPLVFS